MLFAPQYKGISIEAVLEQVQQFPEMEQYLPDRRDWHRLPRGWLINLFHSVVGRPFAQWVGSAIDERNEKLTVKQDLLIEMDADIADAFLKSKSFSSKCASPFISNPSTDEER